MTLCLATFLAVFARAIQQLNVVYSLYWAAALTPFAIAAGDVAVILLAVEHGWASIPWVGLGGAMGALSAMWAHKRLRTHLQCTDRLPLTGEEPS